MTNKEKAILINALRPFYPLKDLLESLNMAKSSYFYQKTSFSSEDKYVQLRQEIKLIFDNSYQSYGYRRIYIELNNAGLRVSEKVIRKLMKMDNLKIKTPRRAKYNAYKGDISPAADNLLKRNFTANSPNSKWLTDITEFRLPAGKVYLSPLIDCFDGLITSWSVSTVPDSELVNSLLDGAVKNLKRNEKPIIHTDQGSHYRWPGWLSRMEEHGLIRSMSRKGCPQDNAACEGFFGRLKNEMFYGRNWKGVTVEAFIDQLNKYIDWYNCKRIKLSLGGMSPLSYRYKLGIST